MGRAALVAQAVGEGLMSDASVDKIIRNAWFILMWALLMLSDFSGASFGPDDTDAGWLDRSGVALITDHGTGCEYLKPKTGNLHPRLDQAGNHICNEANP